MSSARPSSQDGADRAAFIHREILQIGVLLLVAVAAFVLTRAVAASNRDMNLRNAADWYERGQVAMGAGRVDEAIDAFRRANVRNRDERSYALALARALAAGGDLAAADNALLSLRAAAPEDPEINLELARHAADRADVPGARRFYYSALYAPWPAAQEGERRAVRFELVRFLLTRDEVSRALSELLALRTDLPDEVPLHVAVARLFAQAGDHALALETFQRALRLAPEDGESLTGAAEAAFALGQYRLARGLLQRAPASGELRRTREVVDLVLSRDPLAARLGSSERRRRLVANFSYAEERWRECVGERGSDRPADPESALRIEAHAFADHVRRARTLEQDAVEAGVDMVNRLEQRVVERCGPPTPLDSALLLIARQHGADTR